LVSVMLYTAERDSKAAHVFSSVKV
jgi:hypothetical protein